MHVLVVYKTRRNKIKQKWQMLRQLYLMQMTSFHILEQKGTPGYGKFLSVEAQGQKLIMDMPSRCNSTLTMLFQLLEQTPVLVALACDQNISKTASTTVRNCSFTFEEQSMVEKLVEILSPFQLEHNMKRFLL